MPTRTFNSTRLISSVPAVCLGFLLACASTSRLWAQNPAPDAAAAAGAADEPAAAAAGAADEPAAAAAGVAEPEPDPYIDREKGIRAVGDRIYGAAARFFLDYREAAAGKEPFHADATILLVKTYLLNGQVDEAGQALADHQAHSPGLTEAYYRDALVYWHGAVLLAQGDPQGAIRQVQPLAVPQTSAEYRNLSYQLLGDAYVALRDWASAERALSRVIADFPEAENAPRARLGLVRILLATGQGQRAAALLDELVARGDAMSRVALDRYRVLLHLLRKEVDAALRLYQSIESQRPDRADDEWWLMASRLAEALLGAGRYEDALSVLPHVAGLAPDESRRADALLRTAEAQITLSKPNLAIDTLEGFRKEFPDRDEVIPVVVKLAELLRGARNFMMASDYFGQVVADERAAPGFRYRAAVSQGWCFRQAGQFDKAAEAFLRGEDLGSTAAQKAEALFLAADTGYETENYSVAAEHYARVADVYGDADHAEEARFRQGRCLAEVKLFLQAARVYGQFLEQFPNSDHSREAELARGIALRQAADNPGDYAVAMDALNAFAVSHPDSDQAPRALIEAFQASLGAEKTHQAIEILTRVIDTYPETDLYPHAIYQRARVHFYQANWEAAVNDSRLFLEKFPLLPMATDVLMWLADYNANRGDLRASMRSYLRIVTNHGTSPEAPRALLEGARCAYELDELDSTAGLLEQLAAMSDPEPSAVVRAHGEMLHGDVLARQGSYADALTHFSKARELSADTPLGLAALGRVGDMHYSISDTDPGRLTDAIACFETVIQHPSVPPDIQEKARYRLGKSYERAGDRESAIKTYLDIVYQYEIELGDAKLREWFYFARSGYDAARLLVMSGERGNLRMAARIYERLAAARIPTAADALQKAREIRETHQLNQ